MKKIKLVIIIFFLLSFLTACTNKTEEEHKNAETKITEQIKDINNVSEKRIKESINYIKNNSSNIKDKDIEKNIIYHTKYIEMIIAKIPDNELNELVTISTTYIKTKNKDDLKKLNAYFDKIESKEDIIINNIYIKYHTTNTINNIIEKQTPLVKADLADKLTLTEENINKAINYINNYIETPLANSEVTEKIIYYSLYLSNLGSKENEINSLGTNTLKYIKTLNEKDKNNAKRILNNIMKDQKNKVTALYTQISN